MKRRVGLKDIAARSGYSVTTISKALKDSPDISAVTKEKIKLLADEMRYIPNTVASSLRSGKTKTIAIILGDISNPFFAIMVKELDNELVKHQFNSIIFNTNEKYELEKKAVYIALSKHVDGIILFPTQVDHGDIDIIRRSGIPFVLVGRYFDSVDTDFVIVDDLNGAYLATSYLLKKNHRDILFLNGPLFVSCARDRKIGYEKALREYNVPLKEELVKETSITTGKSKEIIHRMLKESINFSAIFAFSDFIAWEAICVLHSMNLRVPEDVAVVGYDNIQSKYYVPYPLTTIHYSKRELAKKTVQVLMKRINKKDKSSGFYHYVLNTSLVVRGSA